MSASRAETSLKARPGVPVVRRDRGIAPLGHARAGRAGGNRTIESAAPHEDGPMVPRRWYYDDFEGQIHGHLAVCRRGLPGTAPAVGKNCALATTAPSKVWPCNSLHAASADLATTGTAGAAPEEPPPATNKGCRQQERGRLLQRASRVDLLARCAVAAAPGQAREGLSRLIISVSNSSF